ncbi:putative toxin-antitoxin system toxin component, PIN family [Spirosoma knui]
METSPRLPASTSLVFDTNVLISTFVFPGFAADVYDHCALHFELYTSEWILSEFNEKLEYKFGYSSERRNRIISTIQDRHIMITPTNELPTASADPDDNHVLRAALFVKADFLITGDKEHLLPLKRVETTEIVSPREFHERYMT